MTESMRPATVDRRRAFNATWVLAAVAVALWAFGVHQARFLDMGRLGLVSILGWAFYAGLGLVVLCLAVELFQVRLRENILIALIALLVLFVFGTACAIEPTASLPDSWIHAGFIQYIYTHGHVLNGFDARFSWPGSFSLGAVVSAFAGQANALALLRWFPLVIELAYLAPLLVIARYSGVGRRAGWLGVVLFYASNWIYQDYFSPQALNYLFFLVVLAAVFACLQPPRKIRVSAAVGTLRRRFDDLRRRLARRRPADYETSAVWNANVTLAVLGLVALISLASAISHQLTPYALILALTACFVTRRLARPELIVLAALFAVGWLSLGATDFWVGHLSAIFGNVGQIGTTIGSNVTNRVTGSASHRLIVDGRILMTLALYGLAGIGVLRRRPSTRTLEALAAAPFLLVAAQSYGGEGLLRVVLFGLPFTTLLAASAILPARAPTARRFKICPRLGRIGIVAQRVILVAVAFSFALGTTVVRGGNDAYESFSTGEVAAITFAYDHVHAGQTIGLLSSFVPFGHRAVGSVQIYIVAGSTSPTVTFIQRDLLSQQPRFIVLTRSQEAWGEIVGGYPKGWEAGVQAYLVAHGYLTAAHWSTATVLRKGPPRTAVHTTPTRPRIKVRIH